MKNLEWVVDTWVLEIADNPKNGQLALDTISFLNEVLTNHRIGIDSEGEILKEYSKHIRPRTLVSYWFGAIIKTTGKTCKSSGKLSNNYRNFLINKLSFHTDDIKFVAVAYHGSNKYLVSEDSDYTKEIKQYLETNLAVKVFMIKDALNTAKDPY